jgi:hypothetical protein
MSIFSFLFGKPKNQIAKNRPHRKSFGHAVIDGDFLQIESKKYYGFYEISKSQEWIVSWRDSNESGSQGGSRESGPGRLILFSASRNQIVLDKKIQRPNSGHVADTGHCSMEDWRFGNKLQGIFYVFSADGTAIIQRHFDANLFNSAISQNGIFAVCQTCNADGSDGNKLTAFDIVKKRELFSISPPSGRVDEYEFDEDRRQITVVHKKIGKFRYNEDGMFLDGERFENAKLGSKDFVCILMTVEQKLKEEPHSDAKLNRLLTAVSRAKSLFGQNPNGWDAKAFKLEGIVLEELGRANEAIASYSKALAINPKIGVAKRLSSLQKKGGTQ